jgi:hypothetical protein
MRIERHCHRRAAMFRSTTADALHDLEMTAVETVEISESQHRMRKPRRARIVWKMQDFHLGWINLDVEHEAIICQLHPGGQPCVRLRVRQVVSHVRKVGVPRCNPFSDGNRFSEGKVRVMRRVTKRIQHKDVHALHQSPCLVRETVTVRQISEIAEPEAEDWEFAVPQRDRHDANATDRERPRNFVDDQLGHAATLLQRSLEHVGELPSDCGQRFAVAITRDGESLKRVEAAEVVEPEYVIGVGVREQNGVNTRDFVRESLLPQVGCRVDENPRLVADVEIN